MSIAQMIPDEIEWEKENYFQYTVFISSQNWTGITNRMHCYTKMYLYFIQTVKNVKISSLDK